MKTYTEKFLKYQKRKLAEKQKEAQDIIQATFKRSARFAEAMQLHNETMPDVAVNLHFAIGYLESAAYDLKKLKSLDERIALLKEDINDLEESLKLDAEASVTTSEMFGRD